MPWVDLNGTVVPYRLEVRPRRTHAALQIDPDGTVRVLLPPGQTAVPVEEWLRAKGAWIVRHRARALEYLTQQKQFGNGEVYSLLGEPLTLEVIPDSSAKVRQLPGKLQVTAPPDGDIREMVTQWFHGCAQEILPGRVGEWVFRVGARPGQLRIREYKSRWGYCRADGLVALNWRIIQAPVPVVDYVIVHELVHLQHLNHALPFWHKVASIMPNYPSLRDWLRKHGREFFW